MVVLVQVPAPGTAVTALLLAASVLVIAAVCTGLAAEGAPWYDYLLVLGCAGATGMAVATRGRR